MEMKPLSYYASIMLNAFKDLRNYMAQNYVGIIGLGLSTTHGRI